MHFPLVSVVIPVYNVEKYLDRCIESVVNQTYKDLEIILVDDGSTDNSSLMCDEWGTKDSRIKVVHKENQGLGFARNTGIDIATGKYIFFWDSDDFVDVTTVEKCVAASLDNYAEVVIFGRRDLYDDGTIIDRNISSTCEDIFAKEQIINDLLPSMFSYEKGFGSTACGKMFDLDVLKSLNQRFMSERQIVSEDSYFTLQLFSRLNRVAVIRDNLYYYCKRNDSLSRKYDKDRQKKNDAFLNQCIECANTLDLPVKICSHIQARYHGMTLGTMAQIIRSDLSKREKKIELKKIYHNDVLRKTLSSDVIKLDARRPQIFWICLKLKLYCLCTLLLKVSKHR